MNILESLDIIGSSSQEHVAPGAFSVKKATLHHGPGAEYAIGGLIKQILLFEDIETVGVTGYIDLHDNVNLFQGGPLIGHELLYLNFETAGLACGKLFHFRSSSYFCSEHFTKWTVQMVQIHAAKVLKKRMQT